MSRRLPARRRGAVIGASLLLLPQLAQGGGPLVVDTGGSPVGWDVSAAVPVRHDQGGLGVLSQSEAADFVCDLFQTWADVPTANIDFQVDGPIAVDVDETNFGPYMGAAGGATGPRGENVVVFDEDGAIFDLLYGVGTSVVGFAATSWLSDGVTTVAFGTPAPPGAKIIEAFVFLNGEYIDGIDSGSNHEMPLDRFEAVFVHEFGHFAGLHHTQIHGTAGPPDSDVSHTTPRETMFPFIADASQATLGRDDVVSLSVLYPAAGFASSTGRVAGTIFDSAGLYFSGANVIARNVSDDTDAVSWVSGTLEDDGRFELSGLDPSASYRVEVEEVDFFHRGGSSLPPYATPRILPGPPEFYNGALESESPATDDPSAFEPVQVAAGTTLAGVDIHLNTQDFEIDNVSVDPGQLKQFAVGDFDGDEVLDFVATNTGTTFGNRVRFFRGLGGGNFDSPVVIDSFNGNEPVVAAQFNSGVDAYLDIAVASTTRDEVRVYFGDGTGRFSAPTTLLDSPTSSSLRDLVLADLDGDPFADLVAIVSPFGTNATVYAYLGSATGAFTEVTTSLPVGLNTGGWKEGDFRGSAANDLIATKPVPLPLGVWILVGDGAGGFTATSTDLSSAIASFEGGVLAVGDFDGDDNLDVGIPARHPGGPYNFTRGFVQVLLGDGSGGFTYSDRYQFPESEQSDARAVDMDGDSNLDLVSTGAHYGPGKPGAKVTIAFGDGSGTFGEPETTWGLAEFPSNLVAEDFDADGRRDLLVNLSSSLASGTPPDANYAFLRAVPEPETVLGLLAGSGLLVLLRRRREPRAGR